MIHLVAEVKAYPDSKDQVVNLLAGLLEPTRKEEGCCQYELYLDEKLKAYLYSKKFGHRKRPWISICKARTWRRFLKHWKRTIGLNIPRFVLFDLSPNDRRLPARWRVVGSIFVG